MGINAKSWHHAMLVGCYGPRMKMGSVMVATRFALTPRTSALGVTDKFNKNWNDCDGEGTARFRAGNGIEIDAVIHVLSGSSAMT